MLTTEKNKSLKDLNLAFLSAFYFVYTILKYTIKGILK